MTDPKTVTVQERLARMKHKTMPKRDWDTISDAQDLLDRCKEALEALLDSFDDTPQAQAAREVLTQLNGGRNVG